MKEGLGVFLLKISVALYLVANGILGLSSGGDFKTIFQRMKFSGNALNVLVIVASVVALVAGIAILLELFKVELPFLDTLLLIVAIIWAVYIVIEIISWITGGGKENIWHTLQMLAVHFMVLASLLTATKRF